MRFIQAIFLFISLVSFVSCGKIKNVEFDLNGTVASVFTPFHKDWDRSLNLPVIPRYADFLVNKNVRGVLILGELGEGVELTVDERKQVAEAWVSVAKKTRQHVMVHVGGTALKSVKELAAHAEHIGADSLLVSPDVYEKPASTEELIEYLHDVTKAAPRTPLVYYQNPDFNVDVDFKEFFAKVGEKVPTFVGVKYITLSPEELEQSNNVRNNYKIIVGQDEISLAGCVLGMDTMLTGSTTILPELSDEILEYCHSDLNRAQKSQDYMNNVLEKIYSHGSVISSLKVATSMLDNLPLGPVRAPMRPISPNDIKAMAKELRSLGLKVHEYAVVDLYPLSL